MYIAHWRAGKEEEEEGGSGAVELLPAPLNSYIIYNLLYIIDLQSSNSCEA
jgi:hypothetical protein